MCFGYPVVRLLRFATIQHELYMRQIDLNERLSTSAAKGHTTDVLTLLAQGADPNYARLTPYFTRQTALCLQ